MIPEIFVRSANNYDRDAASDESGLDCVEPTLTAQEFKEETDINTLVERFHLTGELPQNVRLPTYGDFENVNSFHDAANAIALAHESFDAMPADVRLRFHNNPAEFLDFTSNMDNLDEARKLGLVPPPEVVQELPDPERVPGVATPRPPRAAETPVTASTEGE